MAGAWQWLAQRRNSQRDRSGSTPELLHRVAGELETLLDQLRPMNSDGGIWNMRVQMAFDTAIAGVARLARCDGVEAARPWARTLGTNVRQAALDNDLMWAAWERRQYRLQEHHHRRVVARLDACLGIVALAARKTGRPS